MLSETYSTTNPTDNWDTQFPVVDNNSCEYNEIDIPFVDPQVAKMHQALIAAREGDLETLQVVL